MEQNVSAEVLTGKVSWFRAAKGYGFIVGPDKEYYVHFSDIEGQPGYRSLAGDDIVQFVPGTGDKGPKAFRVRRIS
jgi:CspA family cold shock protein